MLDLDPLAAWSGFFLCLYAGLMVLFGFVGLSRVRGSDDFATARGSYDPVFLAFAMTATAASGATFPGLPGLVYRAGLSAGKGPWRARSRWVVATTTSCSPP